MPVILCVDDDLLVLQMTRRLFENAGYSVLAASSGAEVLKIVAAHRVDVAVLDGCMPAMDGPALAAALRERMPKLPIVFFTGSPDRLPDSTTNLYDACVEKGGPVSDLVEVVGALLRRTQRRAFVRHPIVAPVGVRLHRPGASTIILGYSFDLSEGGMGADLDRILLTGQVVSMAIQVPGIPQQISSAARVAHRQGERHGFQFLALAEAERKTIRAALSP